MDPTRIWPDFAAASIAYRDDDLIVVCKSAGVSSQAADPANPDDLVTRLKRYLASESGGEAAEAYLGVHQRLDQETSGLLLYTLRRSANASIARQFEARTIEKTYLAAVATRDGRPLQGALRHYLTPRRGGVVRVCERGAPGAQLAVTEVSTLRSRAGRALVQLRPATGRTHQLRVQLAAVGAPVAGDRLYDGADAPRLLLHAASLRFRRPSDDRWLTVRVPAPAEFTRWVERGVDDPFDDLRTVRGRIASAVEARWGLGRAALAPSPTTAFRLFNGASDGLPGLAVDVYDRWLVTHVYGGRAEAALEPLLDLLAELGFDGVYLKRHPKQANLLVDTRDDQLAPAVPVRGAPAPTELRVFEHGLPLFVRLADGLRTGLFLDQRENRRRVRELSRGLDVLNLFAYTGGFSAAAVAGGAKGVVSVDDSGTALAWCTRNVAALGLPGSHRALTADVFEALADLDARRQRFELVIVDPPSYSTTRARRFRVVDDLPELVAAAMRVTGPRGRLLVSVNHRGLSQHALRRSLHAAARRCDRRIASLKDLPAQPDFTVRIDDGFGSKSALLVLE